MKTVLRWDEWAACDATALAELVACGDVSARELALQAQAATQMVNPQISAVVELFDDAIDQPETDGTCLAGPFKGVPFLMKDLGPGGKGAFAGARFRLFAR